MYYVDYLDHGDQIVICEDCNARLWRAESERGSWKYKKKKNFSLCCSYGKVLLPSFKEPPDSYKAFFNGVDAFSKFFLKNIRRYNSMFAFTSMGGKIDFSINKGKAPFIYRISGENYHVLGDMLPPNGEQPVFSQLYIYDTENEVSNRINIAGYVFHFYNNHSIVFIFMSM